jgi:hypothetical protein
MQEMKQSFQSGTFIATNPQHRYLLLCYVVKLADVSNPFRTFDIAEDQAKRLGAEFDMQVRPPFPH